MQHCFGVTTVTADTAYKDESIVEEGMIGRKLLMWKLLRRLIMGKLVSSMEVPPPRRPRILLVW